MYKPGLVPRRSPLTGLLIVAVSLLVVAAGFAVWSLVMFISASDDLGNANQERVTTGALHEQVVSLKEKSRQTIVAAQSVTKATVMSSAVHELDERAGKAVVLVAIKMTVSSNGTEAQDKHQRIEAALARTESGWKLEGIGIVALPGVGS